MHTKQVQLYVLQCVRQTISHTKHAHAHTHTQVVEAVSIVETPPMICVGFVGYSETPQGLRALTCVWAQHVNTELKRRLYKNW